MSWLKNALAIFTLLLFPFSALAQLPDLSGQWVGTLNQNGSPNGFQMTLTLRQRGDKVTGQAAYKANNGSYVTYKVDGAISAGKLQLEDTSVSQASDLTWCKKIYTGTIQMEEAGPSITGTWANDGMSGFYGASPGNGVSCSPGTFRVGQAGANAKIIVEQSIARESRESHVAQLNASHNTQMTQANTRTSDNESQDPFVARCMTHLPKTRGNIGELVEYRKDCVIAYDRLPNGSTAWGVGWGYAGVAAYSLQYGSHIEGDSLAIARKYFTIAQQGGVDVTERLRDLAELESLALQNLKNPRRTYPVDSSHSAQCVLGHPKNRDDVSAISNWLNACAFALQEDFGRSIYWKGSSEAQLMQARVEAEREGGYFLAEIDATNAEGIMKGQVRKGGWSTDKEEKEVAEVVAFIVSQRKHFVETHTLVFRPLTEEERKAQDKSNREGVEAFERMNKQPR